MPSWVIQLIVGIGMQIIGGVMMGKNQANEKPSLKDYEEPTADAHRRIPAVIGTVRVDGLNYIYTGPDRNIKERRVKPPGGKK